MTNEKTKQKVSFWFDKDLVAQLDGLCARDGVTRTSIVVEALERFFDVYTPSPELKKLEDLEQKFDNLANTQEESNKVMLQTVINAIQEQPIVVQQQLPLADNNQDETKKPGLFKRLFKG